MSHRTVDAYALAVVRITVSIEIAAPLERVWMEVADLASHAEWMADAESIVFLTDQRSGSGTRMRVSTRVGLIRTSDVMEVVEWTEHQTIGVRHKGLVGGQGRFTLAKDYGSTLFTWSESLTFPWYLGSVLGAAAARPVLTRIWRRNLERLRRRIETATDQR
jgi:uncharacterized membrane protein